MRTYSPYSHCHAAHLCREWLPAALVAKAMPASMGHITQLRHLVDLKLHPNASGSGSGSNGAARGTGNAAGVDNVARFCCPLTGLDMNGRFRFFVMRPGGHVVSERAVKEARARPTRLLHPVLRAASAGVCICVNVCMCQCAGL